jgi:hypothetical protein
MIRKCQRKSPTDIHTDELLNPKPMYQHRQSKRGILEDPKKEDEERNLTTSWRPFLAACSGMTWRTTARTTSRHTATLHPKGFAHGPKPSFPPPLFFPTPTRPQIRAPVTLSRNEISPPLHPRSSLAFTRPKKQFHLSLPLYPLVSSPLTRTCTYSFSLSLPLLQQHLAQMITDSSAPTLEKQICVRREISSDRHNAKKAQKCTQWPAPKRAIKPPKTPSLGTCSLNGDAYVLLFVGSWQWINERIKMIKTMILPWALHATIGSYRCCYKLVIQAPSSCLI